MAFRPFTRAPYSPITPPAMRVHDHDTQTTLHGDARRVPALPEDPAANERKRITGEILKMVKQVKLCEPSVRLSHTETIHEWERPWHPVFRKRLVASAPTNSDVIDTVQFGQILRPRREGFASDAEYAVALKFFENRRNLFNQALVNYWNVKKLDNVCFYPREWQVANPGFHPTICFCERWETVVYICEPFAVLPAPPAARPVQTIRFELIISTPAHKHEYEARVREWNFCNVSNNWGRSWVPHLILSITPRLGDWLDPTFFRWTIDDGMLRILCSLSCICSIPKAAGLVKMVYDRRMLVNPTSPKMVTETDFAVVYVNLREPEARPKLLQVMHARFNQVKEAAEKELKRKRDESEEGILDAMRKKEVEKKRRTEQVVEEMAKV